MKDYEQIISTVLVKIAELEKVVQQQASRIGELEKRLSKNSSNGSKPPSSGGLKKPARTISLREKGKHNSGGQKGHKGETLKQIESPDVVKKHVLTTCPDCHCSLLSTPVTKIIKRQVFDIPPPKIEVTEHQAEVNYCECCNKTITAAFPAGVLAPVQYGEVIRSWSVYYQYQHFIPEDRLQPLFSELYGIQLATATLTNIYDKIIRDGLAYHETLTPLPYLRMMKCKQKISGGFRSSQGAEKFARIRGFISTIRKRGLSIISSIQSIFSGTIPELSGI